MEEKFSDNLLAAAIEFMRAAKEELGNELGEEKVNAMLDSFDPMLKQQLFIRMLIGDSGLIRIRCCDHQNRKTIAAMKAIRRLFDGDLKKIKQIVNVSHDKPALIPGNYSLSERDAIIAELKDTGYEIL
jgi:hypothetical protein